MRFDRLAIEQFGGVRDLDTGEEPLGSLVVVFGPNESGKTTLFRFLGSMLYGFRPASRSTHPYAPWSGADIEGHAWGRLDDGRPWNVRRRLKSSPWGRMELTESAVDLRNASVPFVGHVPPDVFRKVFSLTLDELAGLDGETWTVIQDRLLASLIRDDVRPARDVADELRAEARKLWRPDRRGRPRAADLTRQISELQEERRRAEGREETLRQAGHELEEARRRYQEIETRLEALSDVRRHLERLVPAARHLAKVDETGRAAERIPNLDDFPERPAQELERARAERERIEEALQDVQERLSAAKKDADDLDDALSVLVRHAEQVQETAPRIRDLGALRERAAAAARSLDVERTRLDRATGAALDPDAEVSPGLTEMARRDGGRAVELIRTLSDARSRLEEVRSESPPAAPAGSSGLRAMPWIGSGALAAGVALVWVGSTTGSALATAAGGAVLLLGALALGAAWDRSRRSNGLVAPPDWLAQRDVRLGDLARQVGAAESALDVWLDHLPVRSEARHGSDAVAVAALADLPARALDVLEAQTTAEGHAARLEEAEENARTLADLLGVVPNSDAELDRWAADLGHRLAEAEREADLRERAQQALATLREERERRVTARDAARAREAALTEALRDAGDGSVDRGVRRVSEGHKGRADRAVLLESFHQEWGSVDELRAELESFQADHPDHALDASSLHEVRGALEGLAREREAITGTIRRAETQIQHLGAQRSVASVHGDIDSLTAERSRLRQERDRLELLANLLDKAEERFRERHQPDVVRRAAKYLSRITDGRYVRMTPTEGDGRDFLLLEQGDGRPVTLEDALSTGTREQVVLSLRLAAADHLDARGERMPLFVDEVFVNWDRGRRERGLELLTELARDRQVFLFTCHADVSERLATLGARVVSLVR